MRKILLMFSITVLLSTLLVVSGCGKEKGLGPGADSDLLALLPDNAAGVITVNFNKFAQQDLFDKMINAEKEKTDKPGKVFKDYQDFVAKTGIDPKKDIHAIAVGLYGQLGAQEPEVVFVVNLNYTKDTLLALIKEHGTDFAEETYNNVGVLKFKDDKGKDMSVSFLSENIIVGGCPECLLKVIDLHKGKGQSIMANAQMKPHLTKLKPNALASFVIGFPEDAKKVHDSGMFKVDLSKAEAIVGSVDYADKTWDAEFKMISPNEEANQQLVSTLNGFKMMAGAGGPELEELVKNIVLTADAESVKLKISITDDLVEKLKDKLPGQAKPAPAETPESESEE